MKVKKAVAENLWEVWIDLQIYSDNSCGTLFVVGDVSEESEINNVTVVKKKFQTCGNKELQLELIPGGNRKNKELHYSEEIKNIEQYDCVSIYYGSEEIERFDQIEKLM